MRCVLSCSPYPYASPPLADFGQNKVWDSNFIIYPEGALRQNRSGMPCVWTSMNQAGNSTDHPCTKVFDNFDKAFFLFLWGGYLKHLHAQLPLHSPAWHAVLDAHAHWMLIGAGHPMVSPRNTSPGHRAVPQPRGIHQQHLPVAPRAAFRVRHVQLHRPRALWPGQHHHAVSVHRGKIGSNSPSSLSLHRLPGRSFSRHLDGSVSRILA